GKH
ncbi:hypothetical protein BVZ54_00575B, partial [Haemophilus influenzae]